ncbi:hypothetical protein QYF61_023466, partial [Mycteria americana]
MTVTDVAILRSHPWRTYVVLVLKRSQALGGGGRSGCKEFNSKFWVVRTRNNCYELEKERFSLDIKKSFFSLRTAQQWDRLPREAVQSPDVEVFNTQWDKVLSNQ